MSLHFKMMMGDRQIGYVSIRRTGPIRTDGEANDYEVTTRLDVEEQSRRTTVKHYYSDGALMLISMACAAAELDRYNQERTRPQ